MPGVFLTLAVGAVFDSQHFGVELVLRRCRVNLERAETARKGDVLSAVDRLIAKEHHLELKQRPPHFGDEGWLGWLRQVSAAQYRADSRRKWFRLEVAIAGGTRFGGDVHG